MAKILFIVGSMRKDSFNRALAQQAATLIGDRAEVNYLEYADIPFMNQDIEFPTPESIARVRSEVQSADAVWIFMPEYNFNIPGVLKNLLDWLSRPLEPNDYANPTAVTGKPVTITSVAGKSAGSGVRASLSQLLGFMKMNVVGGEGVGILLFSDTIEEDANKYYAPSANPCVGYASNDVNATTNIMRGSMNLTETKKLDNGYKFVWDFTTSQANAAHIQPISTASGSILPRVGSMVLTEMLIWVLLYRLSEYRQERRL